MPENHKPAIKSNFPSFKAVIFTRIFLATSLLGITTLHALDLPLPSMEDDETPWDNAPEFVKPTLSIKIPKSPTSTSVAPRKMTVEDLQMLEKEKQLLMAELEKAEHQQNAYAYQELKHLILVNGSASIELAQATPQQKVTVVGFNTSAVASQMESFFDSPLTPTREQALIQQLKNQLIKEQRAKRHQDIRIAKTWDSAGVMTLNIHIDS